MTGIEQLKIEITSITNSIKDYSGSSSKIYNECLLLAEFLEKQKFEEANYLFKKVLEWYENNIDKIKTNGLANFSEHNDNLHVLREINEKTKGDFTLNKVVDSKKQ